MNLIAAMDFLILLLKRGVLSQLTNLDDFANEEENAERCNLYYRINDIDYLLTLTRKQDIEKVPKPKDQN
jgi:hypothetical protein